MIDPNRYHPAGRLLATFTGATEFEAWRNAQRWARQQGFTVGQTSLGHPVACMDAADYAYVAKWRNLTDQERAQVHAKIVGLRRTGPLDVYLMDRAPSKFDRLAEGPVFQG